VISRKLGCVWQPQVVVQRANYLIVDEVYPITPLQQSRFVDDLDRVPFLRVLQGGACACQEHEQPPHRT
jgi:hypothetical protein